MEHLPPVGWGDIATKEHVDQQVALIRKDIDHMNERLAQQSETLDRRLAQQSERLDQRLAQQDERLDRGLAQQDERLDHQISSLRKDLDYQVDTLRHEMRAGFSQVGERLGTELSSHARMWALSIIGTNLTLASAIVGGVAALR